ncbi:hypothetical protein Ljor_2146 [Legionella jordanis]|uniref:Uncharacterized protein n=1 Tax=Legionella jordanis TaxID=456 RepID=A0A0W0VCJ8_9GAMM|nr:hypothetical protein Ljor_2146 [Legionella jordanis]VEH11223.1 Uncharacterised protein [Legionella jordanis]
MLLLWTYGSIIVHMQVLKESRRLMYQYERVSRGFWNEVEADSAQQIKKLPEIISFSQPEEEQTHNIVIAEIKDSLSENLFNVFSSYSEMVSLSGFNYGKVCELKVKPKTHVNAGSLALNLYHVSVPELKSELLVLVDQESQDVVAYARFAYNKQSPHLEAAYKDLSFIVIDAIESKKRGAYSLGTVLVQAIVEYSLTSE